MITSYKRKRIDDVDDDDYYAFDDGTAIAGDSWRSWWALLIAAMGKAHQADRPRARAAATCRSVCHRDWAKRGKVQSNSDSRHLHRGIVRS